MAKASSRISKMPFMFRAKTIPRMPTTRMKIRARINSVLSFVCGLNFFTISWLNVVPEINRAVSAVDIMMAIMAARHKPFSIGGM